MEFSGYICRGLWMDCGVRRFYIVTQTVSNLYATSENRYPHIWKLERNSDAGNPMIDDSIDSLVVVRSGIK